MEGNERVGGLRQQGFHLAEVMFGHTDSRLKVSAWGIEERGDFQIPKDFMLKIDVRHPSIEWYRIRAPQPNRDPCPQALEKGVRKVPASVHLHGDIQLFRCHRLEELLQNPLVLPLGLVSNAM
jgi:hypothetical protein